MNQRWITLFWAKVNKTDSCWLWTGRLDKDGYGKFQVSLPCLNRQHHIRAHRFSWELAHGHPPSGLVLHSCDIPACVRPDHLQVGTQSENIFQAVVRGRHDSVKLTPERVQAIRSKFETSRHVVTLKALAKEYEVSYPTICAVVYRVTWKTL